MQKVALIIPCYNEAKRLDINKVNDLILNSSVSIYFVNDGSKDDTRTIIEQIVSRHLNRCFLIDFQENSGKANTIFKAINQINNHDLYNFIGYFDADFSTPTPEIIRILSNLEINSYDLIFGSRVLLLNAEINRKWQRHVIGRIIITLINLRFKLGVYDTQCGAKIFSKKLISEVFSKPFFTSWLFDVEVFIRLKKNNLLQNACEFPLKEWRDVEGSKLSWKTSFKILKELYLLNKNYK
jgi:glycosyltransferase involved in cell wall biosynthesis